MEDLYPSRVTAEPDIRPRQDPVVFGDWDSAAPLTQEQFVFYKENGFLSLEQVFSPDEIAYLQEESVRLRRDVSRLERETAITEPESGSIRSIFRIHAQSAAFGRLAADARLSRIAKFILNDEVYIHQSRLNYKPGLQGKEFYWHSDFETWHVEDGMPRMRALSISVLLTENTPVNGATMFIPGSHKHYVSCVGETPEKHYKDSLKKQEYGVPDGEIVTRFAEKKGVAMPTGPAGTVIVFDCNILHGSNSNITPFPRSNAFFVYNARSNRLGDPFGPNTPRPEFIGARAAVDFIRPVDGRIAKAAA
ncbi:MAG: ectoine hydroxylase [Alphaproteobacteria bacterium]|nr:ectoine hydroxylase [Alphaproteobacteria bacterium]